MYMYSKMQLFHSKNVLVDNVKFCPASILVEDGIIVEIDQKYELEAIRVKHGIPQNQVHDFGDLVLMPGVVDSHVHINEPGRTDWEGFWTATKAAAAGGITTLIDMPLNSIPATVTPSGLKVKKESAEGKCFVDVGFWGGVIPGNTKHLQEMLKDGVRGFKCFMVPSGVPEFPMVSEADIREALQELSGTGSVLMFHAEMDVSLPEPANITGDPTHYSTFLNTRPDIMEVEAIKIVCKLCDEYKVRCHIVHLSSADALPIIADAKAKGAPLTVETTHHYLCLSSEQIPRGSTVHKSCPPIRDINNQHQLWEAVKSGLIDMIVSDHSPSTPELKASSTGNFLDAWGGIASLQFGLSLLWTYGRKNGLSVPHLVPLLCQNTAKLAGLSEKKGYIRKGNDADFVVWDPSSEWTVTPDILYHKNKISPYLGMKLLGKVKKTIVRGSTVFEDGCLIGNPIGTIIC